MCLQQFTSPSILLSYQYYMLCVHVDLTVCRELMLSIYTSSVTVLPVVTL